MLNSDRNFLESTALLKTLLWSHNETDKQLEPEKPVRCGNHFIEIEIQYMKDD